MRKDKAKKVSIVTEELLKNPLSTLREVESKTGVSKSSIANYIQQDLDKLGLKDDRIIQLTDKDFRMMQKIQGRKFARLDDLDTPVNDTDLNNWDREAKARYSLFRGSATDEDGGLKNIDNVEIN